MNGAPPVSACEARVLYIQVAIASEAETVAMQYNIVVKAYCRGVEVDVQAFDTKLLVFFRNGEINKADVYLGQLCVDGIFTIGEREIDVCLFQYGAVQRGLAEGLSQNVCQQIAALSLAPVCQVQCTRDLRVLYFYLLSL